MSKPLEDNDIGFWSVWSVVLILACLTFATWSTQVRLDAICASIPECRESEDK